MIEVATSLVICIACHSLRLLLLLREKLIRPLRLLVILLPLCMPLLTRGNRVRVRVRVNVGVGLEEVVRR